MSFIFNDNEYNIVCCIQDGFSIFDYVAQNGQVDLFTELLKGPFSSENSLEKVCYSYFNQHFTLKSFL